MKGGGLLYANTLLVQVVTHLLRPAAIYRALELDVPAHWLGAIGASFAVTPLVLAISVGRSVDRFGERPVMLAGALTTGLAVLVYLTWGGAVAGILVGSMALGLGQLAVVVGQQAMIANLSPPAGYDKLFGRYTFAVSAGQAIGPGLLVAFGASGSIPDTQTIFVGAVPLAAALLLTTLAFDGGRRGAPTRDDRSRSARRLLRAEGVVPALSVSALALVAGDVLLVYLPALGAQRGIEAGVVGVLLAVRAVTSMASRFFLGVFTGWVGRRRLLIGSLLMSAVSIAALAPVSPVAVMIALVALAGLGIGTGQPLSMSWLAESAPAGSRGLAMSLRVTANRLGQVVVPAAAGLVSVGAGPAGVLSATALLLTLGGVAARRFPPGPGGRA